MGKRVHTAGVIEVSWTVELPVETQKTKVMCDDPAVEAVIEAVGKTVEVYLWGEDKEPAHVTLEVHEEDVTVEEDDRS